MSAAMAPPPPPGDGHGGPPDPNPIPPALRECTLCHRSLPLDQFVNLKKPTAPPTLHCLDCRQGRNQVRPPYSTPMASKLTVHPEQQVVFLSHDQYPPWQDVQEASLRGRPLLSGKDHHTAEIWQSASRRSLRPAPTSSTTRQSACCRTLRPASPTTSATRTLSWT